MRANSHRYAPNWYPAYNTHWVPLHVSNLYDKKATANCWPAVCHYLVRHHAQCLLPCATSIMQHAICKSPNADVGWLTAQPVHSLVPRHLCAGEAVAHTCFHCPVRCQPVVLPLTIIHAPLPLRYLSAPINRAATCAALTQLLWKALCILQGKSLGINCTLGKPKCSTMQCC